MSFFSSFLVAKGPPYKPPKEVYEDFLKKIEEKEPEVAMSARSEPCPASKRKQPAESNGRGVENGGALKRRSARLNKPCSVADPTNSPVQKKRRKHVPVLSEGESDDSSTEGSIHPIRANPEHSSSDEYASSQSEGEDAIIGTASPGSGVANSPVYGETTNIEETVNSEQGVTARIPVDQSPSNKHKAIQEHERSANPAAISKSGAEKQNDSTESGHSGAETATSVAVINTGESVQIHY